MEMRPSPVIFEKAAYDAHLKAIVFNMLDRLLVDAFSPGIRVLIKPNLLMPSRPKQAILTHPLVVRAAAEYVLEKGGICRIGDSPAIGSFEKLLSDGGYREALSDLDVDIAPFSVSNTIDIGPPFGRIELAADIAAADLIINIAKLKSHVQMRLTLGVKNLFGCVVGLKKTEWHLRAGVDRMLFAQLLVQICRTVSPSVTLVDGILAMEGQGPGNSGTPRPLGVLVGGKNPFAVDAAICRMLGTSPDTLPTQRVARSFGLVTDAVETVGEVPRIPHFQFPVLGPLDFVGPKGFRKFVRKHWIQRPVVDTKTCTLCGKCWSHCPARAITLRDKTLSFDYDPCIRCYCCVEICPNGALSTLETTVGKVLRRATEIGRKWHNRFRKSRHPPSSGCTG
jgi:uncharacterized protein (DUF362 family)/Pyruvate/2-oxoacid:ferredoxin oxidoreductase delta subunit